MPATIGTPYLDARSVKVIVVSQQARAGDPRDGNVRAAEVAPGGGVFRLSLHPMA
jgi:hypothetical protein